MLTTSLDSGKSPEGNNDLQGYVKPAPQVIEDYRALHLQFAIIAQSFIPSITILDTYEDLYHLGCDNPALSHEINKHIVSQLQLSSYSLDDCFNILYHGPYVQSQIVHHYLSEEGAKAIVHQLLEQRSTQKMIVSQTTPTTAA